MKTIVDFKDLNKDDIPLVGGKGANLGEMYNAGFPIPQGFVVTVEAYFKFLEENNLNEPIKNILKNLDTENTGKLQKVSEEIQSLIKQAKFSEELNQDITKAYEKINTFVAVRSSATAEDLPDASFAGQQDTYLNVNGIDNVLKSVKDCIASLFTARAIYYRQRNNFNHMDVGIAVVI